MITETKQKRLHYRKTRFLNQGKSLQELLIQSTKKLHTIGQRTENLADVSAAPDDYTRFINTHIEKSGMYFGNVVAVTPGTNKQVIELEQDAEECDVTQLAPPKSQGGKRQEFLDSLIYFGVLDDHVILLQSRSLTSRELERHFDWLLRQAGQLDNENRVFLEKTIEAKAKKKIEDSPVKKLKIGTPLISNFEQEKESTTGDDSKIRKWVPEGVGMQIVRLLDNSGRLDDLRFDEVLGDNNLEVFVEITYKGRQRSNTQTIMKELSGPLRHAHNEDIELHLEKLGRLTGSELELSKDVPINHISGVVEPTHLFDQMHAWMTEIIDSNILND